MRTQLLAGTFALVASIGLAAAQDAPSGMQGGAQSTQPRQQLNLSREQGQVVQRGLRNEQAQQVPSGQGQVGSKAPDSTTAKPLPNEVSDQVPQTRTFLFVKLPDRILIIDPMSQLVAEVVPADATTGSGADAPSGQQPR